MAAPKSTLTRARRAVIVESVKNGNTIANACRLARVTPEQGRAWIKKSRELDSELELGGEKVAGMSLY